MSEQLFNEDDFVNSTKPWYAQIQNWVMIGLIAAAVGALGTKAYQSVAENRNAAVTHSLIAAQEKLDAAIANPDETKRNQDLDAAIIEADKIAMENPNHTAGRAALLLSANAHYYRAAMSSKRGEETKTSLAKARSGFERYISVAQSNKEKAAGTLSLGNVLENLQFTEKDQAMGKQAEKAYDDVIALVPGTYLAGEAMLGKGRLLSSLTKREQESAAVFAQLAKERKVDVPESLPKTLGEGDKVLQADAIRKLVTQSDVSHEELAEQSARLLRGTTGPQ